MKTIYPVEIIITETDGITINYNGTAYTKEEFEKRFLQPNFMVIYREFDQGDHVKIVVVGEYYTHDDAKKAMEADIDDFIRGNSGKVKAVVSGDYAKATVEYSNWGCEWLLICK